MSRYKYPMTLDEAEDVVAQRKGYKNFPSFCESLEKIPDATRLHSFMREVATAYAVSLVDSQTSQYKPLLDQYHTELAEGQDGEGPGIPYEKWIEMVADSRRGWPAVYQKLATEHKELIKEHRSLQEEFNTLIEAGPREQIALAFHKYMVEGAPNWDNLEQITHTPEDHFDYFIANIYKGAGSEIMCDTCNRGLYNCICNL